MSVKPIKVVCHKYVKGKCDYGDQCKFGVHEQPDAYQGPRWTTGGTTGGPNGSAGGAGGSATRGPDGSKVVTLAEAKENMIQAAIQILNLDPHQDASGEKTNK